MPTSSDDDEQRHKVRHNWHAFHRGRSQKQVQPVLLIQVVSDHASKKLPLIKLPTKLQGSRRGHHYLRYRGVSSEETVYILKNRYISILVTSIVPPLSDSETR